MVGLWLSYVWLWLKRRRSHYSRLRCCVSCLNRPGRYGWLWLWLKGDGRYGFLNCCVRNLNLRFVLTLDASALKI